MVVISSFNDPSCIIRELLNIGFRGPILLTSVAGKALQTNCDLDTFSNVLYVTTDYSIDSEQRIIKNFQDRFSEKYKRKANYTASVYYDLAEIIAYALEINGDDVERIHNFLGKLREYLGVTGHTSYHPDGEVEKPLKVKHIQ